MRPFCSGCPGSMRSGTIPSLTHHAESGDRLPRPTLAKGGPLSVRRARGMPYSRKALSRERLTSGPAGRSRAWHTSKYRDMASWAVRGIYPHSVIRAEPAFQVDGPHVIGVPGVGKGLAPTCSPTSPLAPPHQTRTVQYGARSAGGRQGQVGIDGMQPGDYLLRGPM